MFQKKARVKPWEKLLEIFTALFCVLISWKHVILEKESSVNFRTNHCVLDKQRLAFRDLHIFEWDKEQNQNWNIHERFERRFSKLWLCERIYKSTNRRHMWSKETFSGNGGNFFVKACVFSVLASRVC